MGVSIGWKPVEAKTHWLEVGWRSMMHQMLLDNALYGLLDKSDIPTLREIGKQQRKGIADPPFDHSEDIQKAFEALIRAIRKHGEIYVEFQH